MMLSKFPAVDASGFGGEVDTDLENCLSFGKNLIAVTDAIFLILNFYKPISVLLSNTKIINCVRFELDFRGQIFTRRRSIAVAM